MNTVFLYLVIALQVADLITTYLALKNPNNHEANPLVLDVMNAIGVLPGLLFVKGSVIALLVLAGDLMPMWFLVPLAVLYVWAVWNNLGVINK